MKVWLNISSCLPFKPMNKSVKSCFVFLHCRVINSVEKETCNDEVKRAKETLFTRKWTGKLAKEVAL